MPNESLHTPAQREALEKAYDLLGEHFDCALIVVSSTINDPIDDKEAECSRIYWSGGFMAAIGMAAAAQVRILENEGRKEERPDWE